MFVDEAVASEFGLALRCELLYVGVGLVFAAASRCALSSGVATTMVGVTGVIPSSVRGLVSFVDDAVFIARARVAQSGIRLDVAFVVSVEYSELDRRFAYGFGVTTGLIAFNGVHIWNG